MLWGSKHLWLHVKASFYYESYREVKLRLAKQMQFSFMNPENNRKFIRRRTPKTLWSKYLSSVDMVRYATEHWLYCTVEVTSLSWSYFLVMKIDCFPIVTKLVFDLVKLCCGEFVKFVLHFPDPRRLKLLHCFVRYGIFVLCFPVR